MRKYEGQTFQDISRKIGEDKERRRNRERDKRKIKIQRREG